MLATLRGKERLLLKQEVEHLQAVLVKKNDLINVTLESQERLTETAVKHKRELDAALAELDDAKAKHRETQAALTAKDNSLLEMANKQNELIESL